MNAPPPRQWLELIEGYLAGTLSAAEQKELAELLRSEGRARRLYMEYMDLNAELHWRLQSAHAAPRLEPCTVGGGAELETDRACRADTPGRWSSRRGLMLSAALVALVAVGGILWWTAWRPTDHVAQKPVPGQPTMIPEQPKSPEEMPPGQVVHVEAKETREVKLGNQGYMYVQGPADLELFGASRARLHRGRIRVRTASVQGRGFVVETPRGEVTDLGTEFGVDVGGDADTGVVVFEGKVEMAVVPRGSKGVTEVEHLEVGEGVVVRDTGRRDRIGSIVTGTGKTFQHQNEPSDDGSVRVIAEVWDNLAISKSKKVYQIVPGGLKEDAICYADRPGHEWNGMDEGGMPAFLVGADYVKTITDYKMRKDVRTYVKLARPARLFVFFDQRLTPPPWLRTNFRDTGEKIGMDQGPRWVRRNVYSTLPRGDGPGVSIDTQFRVWERVVTQPGVVELGPNLGRTASSAMYGIAAVALETTTRPEQTAASMASE